MNKSQMPKTTYFVTPSTKHSRKGDLTVRKRKAAVARGQRGGRDGLQQGSEEFLGWQKWGSIITVVVT